MARRRGRRQSTEIGNWFLGGALILIALVLGGVFAFYWIQSKYVTAVDAKTYCPVDGPTSVTAVLFDISDPIEDVTQNDLRNKLEAVSRDVPKGGLIAIYAIGPAGHPTSLYSLCNPGDGSELSQITGNPKIARERWQKAFVEPLEKVLFAIDPNAVADTSPIMASIQSVKVELFDREKTTGYRRFILVSDMVENSEKYSQYKVGVDYDAYVKSGAVKLRDGALAGISFDILYIRRPHLPFSSVEHVTFWNKWLTYFGAESVHAVQLEGSA